MDEKVFLASAGLVVFFIMGALYFREFEVDSIRLRAENMERRVIENESIRDQKKGSLAAQRIKNERAIEGLLAALAVDEMKNKVYALAEEKDRLPHDLLDLIKSCRAAIIGETFPELVLKNGTRLQDATVKKIEGANLTFVHSLGITKTSELPDELADRLRFDFDAVVAAIDAKKTPQISDKPVASAVTDTTPAHPPSFRPPSPSEIALRQKINGLQSRLRELLLQASASATDSESSTRYSLGRVVPEATRSKNTSVGTSAAAATAAANAKAAREQRLAQITELRAEIAQLEAQFHASRMK